MKETIVHSLPFRSPDKYINQSGYRVVEGYRRQGLVRKTFKPSSDISFPSVDHAKTAIDRERRRKQLACKLLVSRGISADQIPQSDYVINASDRGNVTYTEFQTWHSDSKNLSEMGLSILRLPSVALRDIHQSFKAAQSFAKTRGNILDMTGSSVKNDSLTRRAKRCLLPLFYSENITVDKNGAVQFVDITAYEKVENERLRSRYARYVGNILSRGILKAALYFNNQV